MNRLAYLDGGDRGALAMLAMAAMMSPRAGLVIRPRPGPVTDPRTVTVQEAATAPEAETAPVAPDAPKSRQQRRFEARKGIRKAGERARPPRVRYADPLDEAMAAALDAVDAVDCD